MDIIEPGTAEWFESRCGRVTASRVYDATRKLKNGAWSADRANYMTELAVERLTGQATRHFVSAAMQWGIDNEPNARAAYEFLFDVDVLETGFLQHPTIAMCGATPDGRVGSILQEFKCPTSAEHVRTIMTKEILPEYLAQMDLQLACEPNAEAVDFGTYDPRMPPELRLWVFRRMRDQKRIEQLESDVKLFLAELDDMVDRLRAIGHVAEKAA